MTDTAPHQDALGIGPFISEHVYKDINATCLIEGCVSSVTHVRDAVDESVTPEPFSFMLTGAGLLGLSGWIKRQRKR